MFWDVIIYGALAAILIALLLFRPLAPASYVAFFCFILDTDNIFFKILIGAALMTALNALGGRLSGEQFFYYKNGNPTENIEIPQKQALASITRQVIETYLCFIAALTVVLFIDHILGRSKIFYELISFGSSLVIPYYVAKFRKKRNFAINDSFYKIKRDEIQQDQDKIRQQQLEAQKKIQEEQAEKQRQEQAKQDALKRQMQIKTAKEKRDRDTFVSTLIREYGFPENLNQLKENRYDAFDIASLVADHEDWVFAYDELGVHIYKDTVKPMWITNDKKIAAIEEVITYSGLLKKAALTDKSDAPRLMTLLQLDDPLSFVYREISAYSNKPFLRPFYTQIREFTELRHQEFNTLIQARLQYYLGQYKMTQAGFVGERAVEEVLEMHSGAFLVIHNLRLEFPGKDGKVDSVETDTFVMAPYGLFAIETKNYGASGKYNIVVTSDGNWYKEYPSQDTREPARRERMPNPFEQNDRHIAFLERFINEQLGRDMMNYAHIKNIIVLANDNVEIVNDPAARQTLTRVGNLYNQLTQDTTPRFTLDELQRIEKALKENNLPPKKYPMNDYREELRGMVSAYKELLQLPARICAVESKVPSDRTF